MLLCVRKECYGKYFNGTHFWHIFTSTYFIFAIWVEYNYFIPSKTVIGKILVSHIFLHFSPKGNCLLPIWTIDTNIFSRTYFICAIYVKYNYFVPTNIIAANILVAHVFLHFWLQKNYLLLVWTFNIKDFSRTCFIC